MGRQKMRTSFYDKVWEGSPKEERREETKLYLGCRNCGKLHLLPNLEQDYFCPCGTQIVECNMHGRTIKKCNIESRDSLEFEN
jgi:hypothetical protein